MKGRGNPVNTQTHLRVQKRLNKIKGAAEKWGGNLASSFRA